jgi:UDP-glucose 4-epimerase
MKKILITGVAGYIGGCLFAYLKNRYDVYGLDKVKKHNSNRCFKIDLINLKETNKILKKIKPEIIIHLAGQSTIDGIENKNLYIKNNQIATLNIVKLIKINKIKNIIFSSTAAVYDGRNKNILNERSKLRPNNIYGVTKLRCENIIKKSKINYIIFRFFNVCSSIPFLEVGELHEPETHLIPLAVNKILANENIKIYGNNFQTRDGTCIRDYIHIQDLCIAFEKTIKKMLNKEISKKIINLGSGKGHTTLEIVNKIITITKKYKYKIIFAERRFGDVAKLMCSYKKANKLLKWKPHNSNLTKIIQDEIGWQKKNLKRKLIY